MNKSWFIYYGLRIGLKKREVLTAPYGEFADLLACYFIDTGRAEPKKKKLTMEEFLRLR